MRPIWLQCGLSQPLQVLSPFSASAVKADLHLVCSRNRQAAAEITAGSRSSPASTSSTGRCTLWRHASCTQLAKRRPSTTAWCHATSPTKAISTPTLCNNVAARVCHASAEVVAVQGLTLPGQTLQCNAGFPRSFSAPANIAVQQGRSAGMPAGLLLHNSQQL